MKKERADADKYVIFLSSTARGVIMRLLFEMGLIYYVCLLEKAGRLIPASEKLFSRAFRADKISDAGLKYQKARQLKCIFLILAALFKLVFLLVFPICSL